MKLSLKNRLILCWQIWTTTSGHKHPASEKDLKIFQNGYKAGFADGKQH